MKKSISSLNSLYKLVAREISGQASQKDKERVEIWKSSSPKAAEDYTDLKRIWGKRYFAKEDIELVTQREANEKIWESVFGQDEKKHNSSIDTSILVKIAAAFIIIFSVAFVISFIVDNDNPKEVATITEIHKQTLPGQKSTIHLPDGSTAYLNSGSKISYLSNYNDSVRIINLEGQVFFDVFKDKDKPFIVRCRGLEVEALGTQFDVNSFGESIQVSLLRGSVELHLSGTNESKSLILNPGEYSIVNRENKLVKKGNFDPYKVLAWKDGRMIFNKATIQEIIPKLEMWYGVTIDNQTIQLSNKHFNSTFEKENLDNILHNMGLSMGFMHKIQGSKVTLKNKMPM